MTKPNALDNAYWQLTRCGKQRRPATGIMTWITVKMQEMYKCKSLNTQQFWNLSNQPEWLAHPLQLHVI
jgi:hypothetical protein